MRPQPITKQEFQAKILHLRGVLNNRGYRGIYLSSEGAMRWLTGMRHQVTDIAPLDSTTIHCLIKPDKESTILHFYCERWEQNRLQSFLHDPLFSSEAVKVRYSLIEELYHDDNVLFPGDTGYRELEREIVSVLIEHLQGNQMDKLNYLVSNSRKALIEISRLVEEGMTGWDLRSLVYEKFHQKHLELNQVVLGLSGMESFQHPVTDDDSTVQKGSVIKIVVGARYFDMLHSASQLVKIGQDVTPFEMKVYKALAAFSLSYAATFTSEAAEKDIYERAYPIAVKVEEEYQLEGFSQCAYLHHLGGPLSPLGNREFLIKKGGNRRILPYSQFAVNPVDPILFHKCELQGIVIPDGPPVILDEFALVEHEFMTMPYNGRKVRIPTIISTKEK
ncbi:MAG: hypothetical protein PQJ47_04750 [Sphaerochaetaceae bacterium]|nr:hypothetical protein [Sphaerochaetaceae bacterium]